MAVPEQGEFFLERALCHQHTLGPPLSGPSHFQRVGPQPIEKTIDNGLQGATPAGFDLDPHGLAVDPGNTHGIGPAFGKRVQRCIEHSGFVERRDVAVVDVLVVYQMPNRGGWRHRRQVVNFLGWTAKTGPLQEMGGPVRAPVLGSDGRQVARPGMGSGSQILLLGASLLSEERSQQQDEKDTGSSPYPADEPPRSRVPNPLHRLTFPTPDIYSLSRLPHKMPKNPPIQSSCPAPLPCLDWRENISA